jgi:membrane-bound lytic murein transglycosylase B
MKATKTAFVRVAVAVGCAGGVALLMTASGVSGASAEHTVAPPQSTSWIPLSRLITTLTQLSAGAPQGAKVLPPSPVHVAKPAPATPPVISGLAANGIPNVALNAYRVAAARMASADPSCGIGWSLLAGIGRIESDHGQYGGAQLLSNGTSTIPTIGPALDGNKWDFISDTDGGRLDGDPRYDHAVGPMQFIPSTWAMYGTDANGDGVANPFDINDAALSAARYLCAAGGDLRTTAGQTQAVLAYNHSDQYLAMVLATAAAYGAGLPVSGPISGITTGPLPGIDGSFIPPVNPGAMRGVPSAPSGPSTLAQPQPRRVGTAPKPSRAPAAGTAPARSGSGTAGGGSGNTGAAAPPQGKSGGGGGNSTAAPASSAAPAPSAPAVPAPVSSVVKPVICTITNLLGVIVQVPCPTPTR